MPTTPFSPRERLSLMALATFGFAGLNGAFLYGLLARPGALAAALANPVSAAFVIEALVMTGVLAWLFVRCGLSRLHWGAFVLLALAGGIAFAVPVALLFGKGRLSETPSG